MIDYLAVKEESVFGRYVTCETLKTVWLTRLPNSCVKDVGYSVNGETIFSISVGSGENRILMWSQMHGNESTTTKAVLDLINFLNSDNSFATEILENCSLLIVPILNPDGAKNYTRVNASEIDLNRDAKQLTQPESKILRKLFADFKPNFCFNLHDQRTLFSAGNTNKPATVAFLSPASDESRKLTPVREKAMKLIVAMNKKLQTLIPGQVGRYDDGFNDNCVGDSFQMAGVPTILFEAGHFPDDYNRERTRELVFYALIESLGVVAQNQVEDFKTEDYFKIPENQKLFYDILVRNSQIVNTELNEETCIGIRFKEVLKDDSISFEPEVADIGLLKGYYGHKTYDCLQQKDLKLLSSQANILQLIKNIEA
ncbi:M14 family metallopeptidase [Flagellimonas pacifica]|uniref:Zinc carboxypeptidase n=1 Tax=Flagellimonas pacifica TaxID=1247520 RepID=A0A285MVK6_9FLAO|nr:M14 metallopeptidase family protein [Allomuricauda parva]SNY99836.1 Zinc carboxypeptidase [Allomuricauda parva]